MTPAALPRQGLLAAIVVDADAGTRCPVDFETQEWTALLEWLEFHGLDPKLIPARTRIERHAGQCLISYVRIKVDEHGHPRIKVDEHGHPRLNPGSGHMWLTEAAIEQGEAAPLPFPDVVARWLS